MHLIRSWRLAFERQSLVAPLWLSLLDEAVDALLAIFELQVVNHRNCAGFVRRVQVHTKLLIVEMLAERNHRPRLCFDRIADLGQLGVELLARDNAADEANP